MNKLLVALLAVWVAGSLIIGWRWAENGRYQIREGEGILVVDTRTGATYHRAPGTENEVAQKTPPIQ